MHEPATCFPSKEGQQQLRQGAKPSPIKLINKPAVLKSKTAAPVQQQARGPSVWGESLTQMDPFTKQS
jgi:hypothetical protein